MGLAGVLGASYMFNKSKRVDNNIDSMIILKIKKFLADFCDSWDSRSYIRGFNSIFVMEC